MSFNTLPEDQVPFPVQTFFNAIWDGNFYEVIDDLRRGVGRWINGNHCDFPTDLDPGEEPFVGIRFTHYEESMIISDAALYHCIALACERYQARATG